MFHHYKPKLCGYHNCPESFIEKLQNVYFNLQLVEEMIERFEIS
jgi:hypothetical protein